MSAAATDASSKLVAIRHRRLCCAGRADCAAGAAAWPSRGGAWPPSVAVDDARLPGIDRGPTATDDNVNALKRACAQAQISGDAARGMRACGARHAWAASRHAAMSGAYAAGSIGLPAAMGALVWRWR